MQVRGVASYKTRFDPTFLYKKMFLPNQESDSQFLSIRLMCLSF